MFLLHFCLATHISHYLLLCAAHKSHEDSNILIYTSVVFDLRFNLCFIYIVLLSVHYTVNLTYFPDYDVCFQVCKWLV